MVKFDETCGDCGKQADVASRQEVFNVQHELIAVFCQNCRLKMTSTPQDVYGKV